MPIPIRHEVIVCEVCGNNTARRSEPTYVIGMILLFVFLTLFQSLFDERSPFPDWLFTSAPPWVQSLVRWGFIVLFFAAFLPVGYHELVDREHTFVCRECGHKMRRAARPFTLIEKLIAIIFISGLSVFAILAYTLWNLR